MATTLRLPTELKTEADAFAARLGISLNALAAVALRDYLDGRRHRRTPSSAAPSASVAPPASTLRPAVKDSPINPPHPYTVASRSDPCPCGAKGPDGHRLKFKHCHGRAGGS